MDFYFMDKKMWLILERKLTDIDLRVVLVSLKHSIKIYFF